MQKTMFFDKPLGDVLKEKDCYPAAPLIELTAFKAEWGGKSDEVIIIGKLLGWAPIFDAKSSSPALLEKPIPICSMVSWEGIGIVGAHSDFSARTDGESEILNHALTGKGNADLLGLATSNYILALISRALRWRDGNSPHRTDGVGNYVLSSSDGQKPLWIMQRCLPVHTESHLNFLIQLIRDRDKGIEIRARALMGRSFSSLANDSKLEL